jgi:4-amino-4-deoxy-L-arabinose transferase-like glycosyltransferase
LTKLPWPRAVLILALTTLAGFALRLPLLLRFPLREDEAIYGYWALHAWYVDPFFLQVWPDKPPIFLWLLSAALQLWGHGPETAGPGARWINIMAGTLTIPVLAACARRWWGQRAAIAAALIVALNPFAISFAPTAFTDPLLVLAGSLALALIVGRHWLWSGLWLGIAIMTKQQGLLFAPLVGACVLCLPPIRNNGDSGSYRSVLANFLRFLAGLAVVVLPILYWDSSRWAVAPSPWDLGATNMGGVTLLPLSTWVERALSWTELLWYLLASTPLWAVYGLVLSCAVVLAWRRRAAVATWLPALLLAAWAASFLLLHVGTSIQVWDRYLLPLIIPVALSSGWAATELIRVHQVSSPHTWLRAAAPACLCNNAWRRWLMVATLTAILLILAGPAFLAAQGGFPIGGDHGAYSGLDETLAAVDTPHSLLFHRELGWHARFALFDSIRNGDVELRYFPSAVYLADSASKSQHKQRFVIIPDWAPLTDLQLQLAARRLQAKLYLRKGHFTVYQLKDLPSPDTSWRVCSKVPYWKNRLRWLPLRRVYMSAMIPMKPRTLSSIVRWYRHAPSQAPR